MHAPCMQCTYTAPMGRTVQIRDLPDDVHQVIRTRAAAAGLSLAEYLRREVTVLARRPSLPEWLEHSRGVTQQSPSVSTGDIVAAMRADRDTR